MKRAIVKKLGTSNISKDRRKGERRQFPSRVFQYMENPGVSTIPPSAMGRPLPKIPLYKRENGIVTTDTRNPLNGRRNGKLSRPGRSGPEDRRTIKGKTQIIDGVKYVILPANRKLNSPLPNDVKIFTPQKGSPKQAFENRRGTGRPGRSTDKK